MDKQNKKDKNYKEIEKKVEQSIEFLSQMVKVELLKGRELYIEKMDGEVFRAYKFKDGLYMAILSEEGNTEGFHMYWGITDDFIKGELPGIMAEEKSLEFRDGNETMWNTVYLLIKEQMKVTPENLVN